MVGAVLDQPTAPLAKFVAMVIADDYGEDCYVATRAQLVTTVARVTGFEVETVECVFDRFVAVGVLTFGPDQRAGGTVARMCPQALRSFRVGSEVVAHEAEVWS